jgi:hypothetical protein
MGIGNTIDQYVKASEATKQRKYTSYARICVYMNIAQALLGTVILEHQDEDWSQTLDYEHILFRCRRCHKHGHLFRDCPLTQPAPKAEQNMQKDGFITIQSRKKNPPRKQAASPKPGIPTKNAYDILSQVPEEAKIQDPHNGTKKGTGPGHMPSPAQNQETHVEERGEEYGDTPMQLDTQDLAGIILEKLEESLNARDLQGLPKEQLRKLHKFFLDSTAGSTARLGIATESSSGSKKIPCENKRHRRKPTHQLIKGAGNLMINSSQIQKLSEGYLHPHSSTQ